MTPPPPEAGTASLPAGAAPAAPRRRLRATLPLLGPAFVAAVAYVDPGNVATNVQGGARYGYLLLWVVLAANLMAMLVQYLSSKAGIATGHTLAELCRDNLPRWASLALWAQAELMAMATDLAEFVGAAVALDLLFGVPPLTAGLITGAVSLGILALRPRGYRRFEVTIVGLLAVVLLGFLYAGLRSGADPGGVLRGLVPSLHGPDSLLLATGIVGATVMPHAIHLHSALSQERLASLGGATERRRLLGAQRLDVTLGMGVAALLNLGMLVVAAAVLGGGGGDTLEAAHATFGRVLGGGAAVAFALALLASGLAASSVGTLAGQVVMQGFLRRTLPLALRRAVTMAPALLVLGLGVDPTRSLVISQVVLSFGIPFALVPLVVLTGRRSVMGDLVNRRTTTVAAGLVAGVIVGLNVVLLATTAGL
ncbi:MAG TPA: Nramp family divalent metal transporter [Candidatus Dormibacteraeota bacterium]|jgi:manganese transport protein|nr:Nramp family divalent metal transporter [Candidatus Dormibacteraeota bacterium]